MNCPNCESQMQIYDYMKIECLSCFQTFVVLDENEFMSGNISNIIPVADYKKGITGIRIKHKVSLKKELCDYEICKDSEIRGNTDRLTIILSLGFFFSGMVYKIFPLMLVGILAIFVPSLTAGLYIKYRKKNYKND